jgi:hypothetical protein
MIRYAKLETFYSKITHVALELEILCILLRKRTVLWAMRAHRRVEINKLLRKEIKKVVHFRKAIILNTVVDI